MRDYGMVSPQFWLGETGKKLRGHRDQQIVALYLITSPHANMTGVYHLPPLYIAHDTGLPLKGASKALRSLIEAGFCEYDEAKETVFVIRMAAIQVAESLQPLDKRVPWLKKEVEKMTSAALKERFLQTYGQAFHLVPENWQGSPIEGASEPHRSQDQDQDIEGYVLGVIPADELMAFMELPMPPSVEELIKIAQERAAEIPWNCPHCNGPLRETSTTPYALKKED
jgi:hypothetical protein